MTAHVHKQIRDVAMAAAGQLYESMMSNNAFYSQWCKQNPGLTPKQLEARFITQNWPRCIDFARATLAQMLVSSNLSEEAKLHIVDVLAQDQSLVRGRDTIH